MRTALRARTPAISARSNRKPFQQATGQLQQALALSRETGNRDDEADALNGLGELLLTTGQHEQASIQYSAALGLACQIGGNYQQARAHRGLTRAHQAVGDSGRAPPPLAASPHPLR